MRWAGHDKGKRDEYKTADKVGRLCDFLSLVTFAVAQTANVIVIWIGVLH